MKSLYWKIFRVFFIFKKVAIDGKSIAGAKLAWSYYMLDLSTLRAFPDFPKNMLPSRALNPKVVINDDTKFYHQDDTK